MVSDSSEFEARIVRDRPGSETIEGRRVGGLALDVATRLDHGPRPNSPPLLEPAALGRPPHALFACLRLIGLLSCLACLLTPARAAEPLRFSRLTAEQGLSQDTVPAIFQDRLGYLWFGTDEGLNRYDGYAFVVYRHRQGDIHSLPDNMISALFQDSRGRFWIGTEHGLCRYDPALNAFTPEPAIRDRVTAIAERSDGTLYVGSLGSGLFVLRPGESTFASYVPRANEPDGLSSYLITSLLVDHAGRLWVGTANAGVDLFSPTPVAPDRFLHFRHDAANPGSLSHDNVWSLAEDKTGALWVATYGGGLDRLDTGASAFRHYSVDAPDSHGFPTNLVTCVMGDRDGTVWAGTDGAGLLRYERERDTFVAYRNSEGVSASISSNVVRSIYEDHSGRLWIGTFQAGVNMVSRGRPGFAYHVGDTSGETALNDPVSSFCADGSGGYWFGTEAGMLIHFDAASRTYQSYAFKAERAGKAALLSLARDDAGRIWIGSYLGGLGVFDPATRGFRIFRHDDRDASTPASDEIWSVALGQDGILWLATANGLDAFDTRSGRVLRHLGGPLGNQSLRALAWDPSGALWVGGLGGVCLVNPSSLAVLRRYSHDPADPSSLSNDFVISLCVDRDGSLWCGTAGGGLNHLVDAAKGVFQHEANLPSNTVNAIEQAADGAIWLTSNRGITRVDAKSGRAEHFDLTNGLQILQFHQNAGLRLADGRILFGSMKGHYEIAPAAIAPLNEEPPVVFTGYRVVGKTEEHGHPTSLLRSIELRPGDSIVTIDFAALDYRVPQKTAYAYRLDDDADKWVDLGTSHEVTFTNLSPGVHRFTVRAANRDGVWGASSVATLEIDVVPPFWRTWWFKTLAAAAALGLAITWYRRRIGRLERLMAERNEAAVLRSKLEAELAQSRKMEALGTLAGGIAHDFNNVLTVIIGNAELAEMDLGPSHPASEQLSQLLKAARRAKDVVKQILTYSHKQAGRRTSVDLRDVVSEAVSLLKVSIPSTVEVSLVTTSEPARILADATQLHQVLINLVTNAVHAMEPKGGRLEIGVQVEEIDGARTLRRPTLKAGRFAVLVVKDHGCGMGAETLARVFEPYFTTKEQGKGTGLGLSVVYGITQQHQAQIAIESALGQGTMVSVYFPLRDGALEAKPSAAPTLRQGSGQRIVVVDDDTMVLTVSATLLPKLGYTAETYSDPLAALEAMRSRPLDVDLLLTDLTMPKMTGLELATQVRTFRPDLPIVVCTGFDRGTDAIDYQARGLVGPIPKPFTIAGLSTVLAEAFAQAGSAKH